MNPPKLPKCVEGLGSGGLASTGKREKKKVRKILDTTADWHQLARGKKRKCERFLTQPFDLFFSIGVSVKVVSRIFRLCDVLGHLLSLIVFYSLLL